MNNDNNQSPPGKEGNPEQQAKVFMAVTLSFDEQSKCLNAVLTTTNTDPEINYQSLQELIKVQGFESFQVPGSALENVLRKIRSGEACTVELAEKPEYTAISFAYNEKTRSLSAELTAADENPKITWASLQETIRENNYEAFQIQGKVLQDLLKQAANNQRGSFVIGEKPEYTHVALVYDEQSRVLGSVLSATDDDPKITLSSLQEMIADQGYESYLPKGTELQALYKRITNKERGTFPLGEKPQYTDLQLVFDEAGNSLTAVLTATDDNPNISLQSLQETLCSNQVAHFFFEPDALNKLLERIENKERGDFPLAERKDAEAVITLSDDEMAAFITTTPSFGGKDLTEAVINAAITEAGIEPDFCDQSVLTQVLESPCVTALQLAEGKAPVDGLDAQFKALVEEIVYHAPKIDEKSGKTDHTTIQDFTIVDVGDPVMQRIPATAGTNGSNVMGLLLPAQPGNDIPFAAGAEGVIVDSNDSNRLLANAKGHPVIMKDGVRIDKTLKVNNVDIRTGNITLDGSILVTGEVKADMEINVTGDVIVGGIVASASIIAGNDIIIKGGVIGTEEKGLPLAAKLSAGGNIKAQFVSLASLTAGKNIEVAEYIAHSEISAMEKVLVGQAGGKGRLFGGCCHAVDGVVANSVGTDADVRTVISVGYASELQKKYNELIEEKTALSAQADQLSTVFRQYLEQHKKQALSQQKIDKARTIKHTVTSLKERVEVINEQLAALKCELKSVKASEIIVKIIIYANVQVTVNGLELPIRKQTKGGHFVQQGNDIRWAAL